MRDNSYIMELPFFEDLTKKEQELVGSYATVRHYEAGETIHSHENECLGLIKVLSGSARGFMLSEEGREITLYHLKKGDIDVLSASCVLSQITFETQLLADTDCEILIVPAIYMAELKEKNLYVRCFIFEKLGERFSDAMMVMQDILFVKLDTRIARVLLKGEVDGIVKATHEEIATRVNSSREVVSRILKEMEGRGIISLGRGKVKIRDRQALGDI